MYIYKYDIAKFLGRGAKNAPMALIFGLRHNPKEYISRFQVDPYRIDWFLNFMAKLVFYVWELFLILENCPS